MTFQWDPDKARRNLEKHGISFADAAEILLDAYAITVDDESIEEQRHITIGLDPLGRVLVVVYMWRGDNISVISARKAAVAERAQYEEGR